jgi:hypothetical protein
MDEDLDPDGIAAALLASISVLLRRVRQVPVGDGLALPERTALSHLERLGPVGDRYKWTALTNTTAAVFMSALDGSIVLIALPAIFRGVHLDPLARATSPTCCG